jgi:hypothetical protein
VPPLPEQTAETANALMAEAERAAGNARCGRKPAGPGSFNQPTLSRGDAMNRLPVLLALPLALAACNVERDAANDTTAISVNDQKVEGAVDRCRQPALEGAAGEVRKAADEAAPAIEGAARDVGNAADRAGDKIEAGAEGAARGVREESRDNAPPANNQ